MLKYELLIQLVTQLPAGPYAAIRSPFVEPAGKCCESLGTQLLSIGI
jgi:hypothetical protein